ncbi:Hepatoma-derived growth factor-like protein 1 [Melipona quadrifasciata]|uniref:Hepatoma-derived growth factor-like protein 1 n=1 Tax=Melipona quadrifasciata TaxID=166423 RepID=A0A0M8ZVH9_9HYME|nr:Hepatoma-derived growth factor-like protein 1 [Melipona quadrifasciata]
MVKLHKKFFAGDKVFAKVRGYPPWPAKVEKVIDPTSKNSKYSVYFYGTGETAVCKVEELYTYVENKAKFGKPLRRKFFHEGLIQLEQELKNDRNKASNLDDLKEAGIGDEAAKDGDTNLPTVSSADSDMETGLVIDQEEKKKPLKRKTFSAADRPEVKKRRGKAKSLSASTSDSGRQEALDSQGEESPKEVVSRSVTPSAMHKKRVTMEKKNNLDEAPILEGTVVSGTTSSDTPGRLLLALTFAGEYVGIKLDIDKPKSFESEKAQKLWDWSTARNAMKLKAQLESGEILPEQVKDYLDFNVHVPDEEKRLLAKDGALHRKTNKLRWLRIEAQLLQLDAQIKSNLGLDRAYPDKCLQAMDDMLSLSIDPLMLKKHPHIVGTVKRLRRYIGNLADWKLNDEEETVFKQKAEQIRQKSEHIYNKFKAMFTIPEGQSFWQSFSDQVVHFKELTKDMPEEKVFSLMSDPACPDAIVSEDSPADESGSHPDTDAPVAAVKSEVPTWNETPKESEAK